tara:strand:+ start:1271 stop:1690 length:420 start_codon:yes stop_codon:yes gene_type:complete
MKTIKFNGKNLSVSASEERALFTLSRNNFAAMKSDFYERRGRHGEFILPRNKDRRKQLGIRYIDFRVGIRTVHDVDGMTYRNATARERKFFTEHPRSQSVITGNPRRINAILKALDAEVEKECKQELEWIRDIDCQTPL